MKTLKLYSRSTIKFRLAWPWYPCSFSCFFEKMNFHRRAIDEKTINLNNNSKKKLKKKIVNLTKKESYILLYILYYYMYILDVFKILIRFNESVAVCLWSIGRCTPVSQLPSWKRNSYWNGPRLRKRKRKIRYIRLLYVLLYVFLYIYYIVR